MKNIEFRIYDKHKKKFLIKGEKVKRGDVKNLLCEIIDFTDFSIQIDNPDDDRYQFLQYTRITDKNGVKIFEGDIVKLLHTGILIESEKLEKIENFIGVVEFSYGEFILVQRIKNKKETEELEVENEEINEISLFSEIYDLEVLGNIYENSELLKENLGEEL